MKLYDITSNQYVIIRTMYDAWQLDASRDESDYTLTQQPSTTYSKLLKQEIEEDGERGVITELIEYYDPDIEDYADDEIQVHEGTVDDESCTIYIPTCWD